MHRIEEIGPGSVNTKTQSFDDEGQDDKFDKQHVEPIEAAEDPAITLDPSKGLLNFVSTTIGHVIVLPGIQSV